MNVLLHDGAPDGLLTAVAEAADAARGSLEVRPARTAQPGLFEIPRRVAADPIRVERLLEELRTRGSRRIAARALYAALSGQDDAGAALTGYVRQVRRLGPRADDFLAEPSVARIHEISRVVGGELHRFKGLVRFRRLRDGWFWAPIRPDADIVSLLALYFRNRMAADAWLLHDIRRRLGIRWDRRELSWVGKGDLPPRRPDLPEDEAACQTLWQTYFHAIAVRERRNPRIQRQYMPVRYWEHLVEIPGGGDRRPHREG